MLKRYMAGVCLGILSFCCANLNFTFCEEDTFDEDELFARSAVLMDAESGRVLFGKEEDVPRPMASTTKIMTCILALEDMPEDETVTVSQNAAGQPEVRLGIREGEKYRLTDLLYSLMLESHNDAAVAIAEKISGSVTAFAAQMNRKAAELGCTGTHFVTPNGLDGRDGAGIHSTTARDLAAIMRYCISGSPESEAFLEITGTREYSFSDVGGRRTFSCRNHNAFLDMMQGAISGKTGFTGDAGYCYVGALRQGDRTMIAALLACGWPNNKGYKWRDTRKLMEYGLEVFEQADIRAPVKEYYIEVDRAGCEADICKSRKKIRLVCEKPFAGKVLIKTSEKVRMEERLKKNTEAPVKKGTRVGEISVWIDKTKLGSCYMCAGESVEKRDFEWCLKVLLRRFFVDARINDVIE